MYNRLSWLSMWGVGLFLMLLALVSPGCDCGAPAGEEEIGVELPTSGGDRQGQELPSEPAADTTPRDASEPAEPGQEISAGDASEPTRDRQPTEPTEMLPETGNDADAGLPETPADEVFQGPRFHFRVNSKVEDTVPPKLLKVTFQPTTVKAGEWLKITITVGADLSDVTNAQISINGPKDIHSLYVDTTYHPSQKAFQAMVRIPANAEAGVWYAQRLTLLDGARRPSVYTSQQAPLQGTTFTVTSANPDVTGPTLTKLTLDTKQVKVGEILDFSLEASDAVSGISRIEVEVEPDKGGARVTSTVLYDPVRKVFVGKLRFPASAPTGKWKVSRVNLTDGMDNRTFLSSTDAVLQNLTFDVIANGTPPPTDTQAPEVLGAWLEPSIVDAGQPVRVLVAAKDNLSGIRWARVTFSNPVGEVRFQYDLRLNAATGLWEGTGEVPAFSRAGLWRLESIQLTDYANHVINVTKDDLYQKTPLLTEQQRNNRLDHLSFSVKEKAGVDRESPLIKGINLAPGTVKAGESVRVYARLEDPGGSGISSASCTFTGPYGRDTQRQAILTLNSDTGFFEGTLSFDSSDPAGDWWVSGCFLQDKSGNSAPVAGWALTKLPKLDISRATSQASADPFVVKVQASGQQPSSDTKPPVMTSFHIAPGEIQSYGVARFFAKVEDTNGSGVAGGSCQFVAVEGVGLGFGKIKSLSAFIQYNPATGYWESQFNVPREAVRGDWWIESCSWRDHAGNVAAVDAVALAAMPALSLAHIDISPAPDHRVFKIVDGTNPDKKSPVVLSVNIAPSQRDAGESVRVYLKATDDQEIASAFCSLKPALTEPPFAAYGAAHLAWNPKNSLWEGNFRISPNARTGWWSLAGCQVMDRRGNRWDEGPEQIRKLAKLDLSSILGATLSKRTSIPITNPNPRDKDAPIASKVKWLPTTQANAGSSALLQVTAADKGLGILRVEAIVKSPSGQQQVFANLPYNVATKQWEGVVEFPSDAEKGKWSVAKLDLYDLGGNIKNYTAQDALLTSTQIQVVGGTPKSDEKPPEITALKASKSIVLAGESVRWVATISDNLSGVDGGTIQLVSPTKGLIVSGYLEWNPATSKWEAETVLPLNGEDGAWKVNSVTARDKAGNFASLDQQSSVIKGLSITVRNTPVQQDKEPPTIKNISIAPQTINTGESFLVSAEVTDNLSGVSDVSVQIESENKERLFFLSLRWNPATQLFEGIQEITPDAPGGNWLITSITLRDNAGNTRLISKGDAFLP